MKSKRIRVFAISGAELTVIGKTLRKEPQINLIEITSKKTEIKLQIVEHQPDLLIWSFPLLETAHIKAVNDLKKSFPDIRILILTPKFSRCLIPLVLRSSIDGVLTINKIEEFLARVVGQIYQGIFTMFIDDERMN